MTTGEPIALTEREKEALRFLLQGHDAKSVANTLGLSIHTINERLRDARRKLGVSSSREAARRLAEIEGTTPKIVVSRKIGEAETPETADKNSEPAMLPPSGRQLTWFSGGMLIMSLIIATGTIVAINAHGITPHTIEEVSAPAIRPADIAASDEARKWILLLDNSQWDASWDSASSIFKAKVAMAKWSGMIQSVRGPLGEVSSRSLSSVLAPKTLPDAPEGVYRVIAFHTRFTKKPDAIETVVLTYEDARWRVCGYFIH